MEAERQSGVSRRNLLVAAAGVTAAAGASALLALPGAQERRRRADRKIVRLWHLLSAEWLEPVVRAVKRYNESQGLYEVQPLLLPSAEADTKLLIAAAGGDPPDVLLVWSQITSAWAASNIIQPLDPFMTAD